MTASADLFLRFGVALAIGFMIGLQREYAFRTVERELVAGERTFALMGLVGALAAMSADLTSSSIAFLGVILLVGIFTAIAYFIDAWRGQVGLTTEVAILITVLIGALCYWNYLTLAAALGIATTVLLSLKIETDRLVKALTREDIFAALQLAVITIIVLPILPNESLLPPPFDVLNPFKIWLMVVFISGINFLGYIAIKFVGPERGIGITGLLGGLISSTAVTLGFSERSNREQGLSKPFALAIMIAWTVMFARILVEVGVLNLDLLAVVWLPIAASGLAGIFYCIYLYISQRVSETDTQEFSNPFDLISAIKFGLLYAVILVVARAAQMYFGDTGVYISSLVSGFADVDAITLSLAQLSNTGGLSFQVAAEGIVLAMIANTIAKGSIVLLGGAKPLKRALLPGLILVLITAIGVTLLVI
ncbi:MAG: MgtC/SapB family protein [Chloroflexota bacterium]|nr:MAG: MgtC/SapB family protein [Chloroflexota bacterium]